MEEAAEQPDPNEQRIKDVKRLRDICFQLTEHFDSVQIIVTRFNSEKNGTTVCAQGMGNYYARKASTEDWIKAQDADIIHEQDPNNRE